MKKKLQVFISSTYTDLIEERQAAVEAILNAGHIPAGMELFKAGNDSQLKTIYRWIDESDVYMLILGRRYGSIEPKSGKSYTRLEYEYALSKNIPVFAVVLSEKAIIDKINSLGLSNATEQEHSTAYQDFRKLVMSKIIKEVDDCKDIENAILAALHEFMEDSGLIGWVRGNTDVENDAYCKKIAPIYDRIQMHPGSSVKENANQFFLNNFSYFNTGYEYSYYPNVDLFINDKLLYRTTKDGKEIVKLSEFGYKYHAYLKSLEL